VAAVGRKPEALAAMPGLVEPGSFYCFPNPLRGEADDVGVAYTLASGVTGIEVRVYATSGVEVERLQGPAGPAQNVARIPVKKLASGVYLVRLEAARGGDREVLFYKFAVVK
jgi:hypothetical protein